MSETTHKPRWHQSGRYLYDHQAKIRVAEFTEPSPCYSEQTARQLSADLLNAANATLEAAARIRSLLSLIDTLRVTVRAPDAEAARRVRQRIAASTATRKAEEWLRRVTPKEGT